MRNTESDRWIRIEQSTADQIDHLMESGYLLLQNSQSAAACQSWHKAWFMILELFKRNPEVSTEDLDDSFRGKQSISNWARDYELELVHAALQDPAYYQTCIEFCQGYLSRTKQPARLNNLNLRRAMAASYFRMGRPGEGDACFTEITRLCPGWAWGWLGCAYQYSFYAKDPWHSLAKAESILREGLMAVDPDGKRDIALRLRDILVDQGKQIEASLIG